MQLWNFIFVGNFELQKINEKFAMTWQLDWTCLCIENVLKFADEMSTIANEITKFREQ